MRPSSTSRPGPVLFNGRKAGMKLPPGRGRPIAPDPSASGRRAPSTYDSAIAATEVQPRRQASPGGVRLGWSIALLACVVQTAVYLTNELVLDTGFHQLNAAADGTLFAWANTLAIVSLAVPGGRGRRPWGHASVALCCSGPGSRASRGRRRNWRPRPDAGIPHVALPVRPARQRPSRGSVRAAAGDRVRPALGRERPRAGRAKAMMRAGLLALAFAVVTRLVGAVFGRHETYSDVVPSRRRRGGEQGLDLEAGFSSRPATAFGRPRFARVILPRRLRTGPHSRPRSLENPRPASTAPRPLPDGAAKTRWFTR